MTAGNRTRTVLILAAVTMVILLTTTHQVSAAELTYDSTVEVSDNESVFNVSVFPGKAGYDNGTISGIFGDGTVVDYRFFTADADTVWSWIDGGEGRVAPITSPPAANVAGPMNNSQNWPDVWITSDPDTDPADFTTNTQAGAQNITGTINISGFGTGSLYFIHGTYFDSFTLSLTMSGPGQADIQAEYFDDPPDTVNMGWITSFTFSEAGSYDTITYSYTNTDADGSRARFMGVIVDGGDISRADDPDPANEQPDVLRDSDLSWSPGIFAAQHDVYLGESFEDVNTATGPTRSGLDVNSFDPGRLDFGTQYFWRIDEVNAPPTSHVVFKGFVWSFTTELLAYPIENVTATASSSNVDEGAENTVNGSGVDANDLHSSDPKAMWISEAGDPGSAWIQYVFDKPYKLHEMFVWNYNGDSILALYGLKEVTIEYSTDGTNWSQLENVPEFAQAIGGKDYAANTTVAFNGAAAKYVKITANSNWGGGGFFNQYGLSEVCFTAIPISAKEPNPEIGATGVAVDAILGWRVGREAATHNVYLSTDEQAIIDGTAPVNTVTGTSYSASLDVDTSYYWRVDEVNDAETTTTWQGEIWNFSTLEFLVVDDFESYNNIDPPDPESHTIFGSWSDGYLTPTTNGALIGYDPAQPPSQPSYMEQTIVYGGSQSLPFSYNNTIAGYSEATVNVANLQVGRDWTKGAPETLVLWVRGGLSNSAAGQLYVKINNTKVMYGGDLSVPIWKQFNVDLVSLGINLSSITTLSIGVDGGGSGMLYVDDIVLYRIAPPVVELAPGGDPSLVGHWKLDETSGLTAADSSGYGNDGTLMNMTGTEWTAGIRDGALMFDGNAQIVDCGNPTSLWLSGEATISAWIKMEPGNEDVYMGIGGKLISGPYNGFALVRHSSNVFRMWMGNDGGDLSSASSDVTYNDTDWHHVVGVISNNTGSLYVNGVKQAEEAACGIVDTGDYAYIGKQYSNGTDRYWVGTIDDVRIYYRALSEQEISDL